jgi:hypothetical protein
VYIYFEPESQLYIYGICLPQYITLHVQARGGIFGVHMKMLVNNCSLELSIPLLIFFEVEQRQKWYETVSYTWFIHTTAHKYPFKQLSNNSGQFIRVNISIVRLELTRLSKNPSSENESVHPPFCDELFFCVDRDFYHLPHQLSSLYMYFWQLLKREHFYNLFKYKNCKVLYV